MITYYLLVAFLYGIHATSVNESMLTVEHKLWTVCDTSGSCICGNNDFGEVNCEDDETLNIKICYCMYYDENAKKAIVGNCMQTCFYRRNSYSIERYSLQNASLVNSVVCSGLLEVRHNNREGRFCGRCKEGYGLAAYSYRYTTCIPCSDYGYKNWIKYFTVALLPLTLFYFLVVILRINVTSSRLNGIVFIMQCAMSPLQLRVMNGWLYARNESLKLYGYPPIKHISIFLSIFSIVNLDFFRDVYPDFCLNPRMNILHVVSLDYIVALYPFLLIFITYVLITMYDNNYRLVVWAWKPFKWFLGRFQDHFHDHCSTRISLMEIFASFLLLSYVKILGVCCDILVPTRAYDMMGKQTRQRYLYTDANIEYFSREHIPFVVLAFSTGFMFVFLPFLLLAVYPCRCFQRCLNHFGWRCQVLHAFMDVFQGSYQTEPYDLRYFSAYYLALRFFLLVFTNISMSQLYITIFLLVLVVGTVIFGIFQPYKNNSHNKLDSVAMLLLIIFYVTFTAIIFSTYLDSYWLIPSECLFVASILVMTLYIIGLLFWMAFGNMLKSKYSKFSQNREVCNSELIDAIEERSLEYSHEYTPLLTS